MIGVLASVMVILLMYAMPLFMLVLPFFPAALMWFIACFNSYPVIQKYVIDPYYEEKGEINPERTDGFEDIDEEPVFEDMGGREKPIEKRKKGKGRHIS
jgi:membrane protein insertase Oxa1/YidC/SpoIIIJ